MTKPQVALVIGVLAISIFPILVKLELTPGTISAFYRMAFSAALIIPYAIITRSFKLPKTKYLLFSVLCGFIFGTDIIVWNVAIIESTATQATLLSNLSPVWVGLGTFLFLASKPKINFWIGTVIALFGMVVLIGFDFFFDLSFDRAFLLAILSGMLYANYMLV
ncbi:MAG TPA: DMT family transporter, partial [Flavobacteriaceae bacterium]|nr:DMT family transporter [Flavobacteriaceae bacterium]